MNRRISLRDTKAPPSIGAVEVVMFFLAVFRGVRESANFRAYCTQNMFSLRNPRQGRAGQGRTGQETCISPVECREHVPTKRHLVDPLNREGLGWVGVIVDIIVGSTCTAAFVTRNTTKTRQDGCICRLNSTKRGPRSVSSLSRQS